MDADERKRTLILGVAIVGLAALIGLSLPFMMGGSLQGRQDIVWTPPPSSTLRPARSAALTPARTTRAPTRALHALTPTATASLQPTPHPTAAAPSPTPAPASPSAPAFEAEPTAGPAPTATPSLTPPPPTRARANVPLPNPTPQALVSPPTLVEPAGDALRGGEVTFRWQATGPLPPGAAYEVVWWNLEEGAWMARGLAAPTYSLSLAANLDVLYRTGQVVASQFYWTVLVVNVDPYLRLTLPQDSPAWRLNYRQSGGEAPPPPKP